VRKFLDKNVIKSFKKKTILRKNLFVGDFGRTLKDLRKVFGKFL